MFRTGSIKTIPIFLSALALVAATAANGYAHSGHKHDDKPPIALPEVTAKVNDTDIKREVIIRELQKSIRSYKAKGMTLSPDQLKTAAKKLIDEEIGRTLLLQKGKEIGVAVSPEMVNEKLNQVKASFKSDAVFEHKLADQGMSLDQYQEELRTDLIMNEVIKKEVEPKIKISEKELKAHYEKNIDQFQTEDKVRASVMLIKLKPDSGQQAEQMARKKLESVLEQVKSGSDFGDLAQKFSQDSLAAKGGDLGFFTQKRMLPAFSSRAFKMKVGEVSEIFKTKHGLHILKVTDKKPGATRTFAEEKETIRKTLLERKTAQATRDYVQALKKEAKLKTYF